MLSFKFLTSLAAFIQSSASNGDYSFRRSFIKSKLNKYLVMIIICGQLVDLTLNWTNNDIFTL